MRRSGFDPPQLHQAHPDPGWQPDGLIHRPVAAHHGTIALDAQTPTSTPAELGLTAAEGRLLTSLPHAAAHPEIRLGPPGQLRAGRRLPAVRARRAAPSRGPCLRSGLRRGLRALWLQGEPPLVMDLTATREDADHVVTLFRRDGCWGAILKNIWLRWRDRSIAACASARCPTSTNTSTRPQDPAHLFGLDRPAPLRARHLDHQ